MKLTVYKNQYGFSTLAKNRDVKIYIPVKFYDCAEPTEERTTIKVEDAFFSNYKDKNNLVKAKLMIKKYKEVEEYQVANSGVSEGSVTTEYSDDLPF